MSSINSLLNGQYYQLPSGTNNGTGDGATVTAPNTITNGGNAASELTALLNGDSDSVDLSPQAQSILDAFNGTGSSNSLSGVGSANASFSLSYAQQQKISEILSKYSDAPLTQDTFDSIQSDLAAAGLSPSQLSQTDSLQSFNSTQVFLDALNGKTDDIPTSNDSDEQTKSSNYMQQVYTEWASMRSSTADDSGDTTGGSSGASA